ncbi:hypothetical protein K402DRAFT_236908 [Aulographum hederae CBS 113979]|uniref:Uncharacterized protein n=1 Tax=Aulographum hederae CBS 113979 TaxID=1176131 RepID=A0A6G1GKC7_9PEZI|nr:hypothetical protein K402DRAFT_236908 [Aulographum hederae CBS 113979]
MEAENGHWERALGMRNGCGTGMTRKIVVIELLNYPQTPTGLLRHPRLFEAHVLQQVVLLPLDASP